MTYPHISPGDKFRPSAEKENSISRLLEGVNNPFSPSMGIFPEESSVTLSYNVGGSPIKAGAPAEIVKDFDGAPELSSDCPAVLVRKIYDFKPITWGVALDYISPGEIGSVQLQGVCVFSGVEGDYALPKINVSEEGKFVYSSTGPARILRRSISEGVAVAFLERPSGYNGMFAVRYNGNGKLEINGGYTDLNFKEKGGVGMFYVEPATVPIEFKRATVVLAARYNSERQWWETEFMQSDYPWANVYIPGEQIYMELANYTYYEGHSCTIEQLWQGGMLPFKSRYFVEI